MKNTIALIMLIAIAPMTSNAKETIFECTLNHTVNSCKTKDGNEVCKDYDFDREKYTFIYDDVLNTIKSDFVDGSKCTLNSAKLICELSKPAGYESYTTPELKGNYLYWKLNLNRSTLDMSIDSYSVKVRENYTKISDANYIGTCFIGKRQF